MLLVAFLVATLKTTVSETSNICPKDGLTAARALLQQQSSSAELQISRHAEIASRAFVTTELEATTVEDTQLVLESDSRRKGFQPSAPASFEKLRIRNSSEAEVDDQHDRDEDRDGASSDFRLKSGWNDLWEKLYPGVPPVRLEQLPDGAARMRIFIYDLDPKYNLDIVRAADHAADRHDANCDWERGPCHQLKWDKEYSTLRMHAAEVVVLSKFLLMPHIVDNPKNADLFVVPFFTTAERIVMDRSPWSGGGNRSHHVVDELVASLSHFKHPAQKRRHVFMDSVDRRDVNKRLLQITQATGSILLTYGPRTPGTRELVMAQNSAGLGAPLQPLRNISSFLFLMAGDVNEPRRVMRREILRLAKLHPELNIQEHAVEHHRKWPISPLQVAEQMKQSLLCPIPEGDTAEQHRFFDALVCGCIPVVIRYRVSSSCEMWSYGLAPGHKTRSCVPDTYPFTSTIDYSEFVIVIDSENFVEGRFAETLLDLDKKELEDKRKKLEAVRHNFVYDWNGKTADAFSNLLYDIHNIIRRSASDP